MARYDTYGAADDQILEDSDTRFRGFNDRSRPDSLEPGMLQQAENVRFDLSGIATKRKSVEVLSAPFTTVGVSQLTLPFNLDPYPPGTNFTPRVSTILGGNRLELEVQGGGTHGGYALGTYGLQVTTDPNNYWDDFVVGNYEMTLGTAGTDVNFIFPNNDFSFRSLGGTVWKVTGPILSNAQNTRVVGSNNFINPQTAEEYILLAGTAFAKAVKISDGTSITINYPAGHVLNEETVTVLQAFDRVYIFEEGHVPMSWDIDFANDFVDEESGTYTQPTLKSGTADITDGLVELTGITNTGFGALVTGDEIVIIDGHNTGLTNGDTYQISESTTTSISFYAQVDNVNNDSLDIIGRVSGGAGFIHAPAPGDAIVHRNRLVVPYKYTINASNDSYTARDVTDELLISFPFNSEKFDTTYGTFVTAGGQNDSFVAAFSFAEDKLLMFNRKSISVVTGVDSFNFQEAKVQSLTKEIGLVAKDSIVQVGNQIIFLSDNGVYGVSFQDLYNLRGNDVPLSAAIDGTIQNIDKDKWHKSSAVYFDNRYYIAVPMPAVNNSNSRIIIYNFLNKAWESVDNVSNTGFHIDKLIVAGSGTKRGVYAVNSLGGVHKLEASDFDKQDSTIVSIGGSAELTNIRSTLRTRQYNLGTVDRKKWNNYEVVLTNEGHASTLVSVRVTTENKDGGSDTSEFTPPNYEGVSYRARIGNVRAYGADATIREDTGRFSLQTFKIAGALTFRSQNEAR
jgi:hypothetical protein